MASLGSITVNIIARTDKFVRGVSKAMATNGRFASAMRRSGAALAGFGATATVVGVQAVRTFEEINRAMAKSLAIMSNVSAEQRREMIKAANDVAKATTKSTAQAAESYYFLASAGFDAAQSLKGMPVVARFAQAGNFDLARATDLATDAQSALGLTSKDTAEQIKNLTAVTDTLIRANTLANASAEQFSLAITTGAGAAMRGANMHMATGVAVLAAFADQGIKGQEAGTAFGIVLRDLQTKALQNQLAFAAAGVSVFDAAGEMRNMADIVSDLERLLTPLSVAQRKATLMAMGFSDKSVKFVQMLVGTSGKIRDYEASLRDAGGAAKDVAEKSMTDLERATTGAAAAWEQLSIRIGEAATRMGLFKGAAEFMEGFGLILEGATSGPGAAAGESDGQDLYRGSRGDTLDRLAATLNTKAQNEAIFNAVLAMAPDRTTGASPERLAELAAQDTNVYDENGNPTGAVTAAQAQADMAKLYDAYIGKPLASLGARGMAGAAQGAGLFGQAAQAVANAEKQAKRAMMQDALFSATFGLFGERATKATPRFGDAPADVFSPRSELAARLGGSLEAYSASRRNLGESREQSRIAEATEESAESLASVVEILGKMSAGGGGLAIAPIDGGVA